MRMSRLIFLAISLRSGELKIIILEKQTRSFSLYYKVGKEISAISQPLIFYFSLILVFILIRLIESGMSLRGQILLQLVSDSTFDLSRKRGLNVVVDGRDLLVSSLRGQTTILLLFYMHSITLRQWMGSFLGLLAKFNLFSISKNFKQIIILRIDQTNKYKIKIMNREKDSVVNYLTPTKLISSSIKSKYRTNMSDIHNKSVQSDNKSLLQNVNNTTIHNKGQPLNVLPKEVITEKQKSAEYSIKNRSQWDNKHFANNVVREESEYNQRKEHQKQISEKGKFQEDDRINRQYFESKISDKKSVLRQGESQQNSHVVQSVNNYPTSPARSEVNQSNSLASELFNLIRRLKSLKQTLDFQLGELHFILNNTTKYLQNIDDEFSKIKQKIINYTSRCIDSAFNDYKIKMNWKRFDDVVKKGTQYKGELEVIIKQQQIEIQKLSLSHDLNEYKVKNKGQQLGKTIVFFDNLNREIEVLKEECIQMKPILKRQNIRAYEQTLTAMVTF